MSDGARETSGNFPAAFEVASKSEYPVGSFVVIGGVFLGFGDRLRLILELSGTSCGNLNVPG